MRANALLDLRQLLEHLRSRQLLVEVDEVEAEYEAAWYLKLYDSRRAVLFCRVKGYEMGAVGNVFTNREILYAVLNARSDKEAFTKLLYAVDNPQKPREVVNINGYKSIGDDVYKLPIFTFYEGDGGPYLTSSIVIAKDPDLVDFQNASFHRMMVIGERKLAVRIVPRHLHKILSKAKARGQDLEVLVAIGAPPHFCVAAATSPPYGVSELNVAVTLAEGRLRAVDVGYSGLLAPEGCEVLILGRILKDETAREGPFVDITGTHDIVRDQPVLEVEDILVRPGAVLYEILPAGEEHRLLMGFPREALIWRSVSAVVPSVKAVRLTRGGCGWLSAVVSIEKRTEGDGKLAILAAFAAHPSLKLVTVVDEDIDVDDPYQVEWALVTRMQPDEDVVIVRGVRGSSLDPSADQRRLITSKMGIDATRPLDKPKEHFARARIPSKGSQQPERAPPS